MKLRSAPLSIFLFCSIGEAHTSVLDKEGKGDRLATDYSRTLIKNPSTGKCVRMNTKNEAFIGDCNDVRAQWDLKSTSKGTMIILTGTDTCLDGSNGGFVGISRCDYDKPKSKSQTWEILTVNSIQRIKNKIAGKCMENRQGILSIAKCQVTEKQNFELKSKPRRVNSELIVNPSTNECMKVDSSDNVEIGSCKKGTVTWSFNEFTNQIQYRDSPNTNMCLDSVAVKGETKAIISRCDANKKSQKWNRNSDNIKNLTSKQCLKLNIKTQNVNLRACGGGDRFVFRFKAPTVYDITSVE